MDFGLFATIAQAITGANDLIRVGDQKIQITTTPQANLRKAEFMDGGNKITAIQQNPATISEWATLARQGHRVVQFKHGARYIAVAVNEQVKPYKNR